MIFGYLIFTLYTISLLASIPICYSNAYLYLLISPTNLHNNYDFYTLIPIFIPKYLSPPPLNQPIMKNLFNPQTKTEVLSRIDQLTPNAKAAWGKMNPAQGLRHLAMAFDIATGKLDPTPVGKISIPKWLLKFFLLNMKPPKEKAETFKEINMVANGINPPDFEAERKNLKNAIENFCNANILVPENKLVGKFTKDNWGKLNYNHTDHHLRQFGV